MQDKPANASEEREALLHRLYAGHLKAVVEIVENTPAVELSAPVLNAITKFLADNAVTHQTINDKEKATEVNANIPFVSTDKSDYEL